MTIFLSVEQEKEYEIIIIEELHPSNTTARERDPDLLV